MEPMILGISASPQKEGKVETLLKEILTSSRLSWKMARLHELTIRPCKACGGCRQDNVCVIDDDWEGLRQQILECSAIVIGGWVFSGMIDSATKALMERFWSFRHHHLLTRGRVGAAVVVGSNTGQAAGLGDALLQFMRNYGLAPLGHVIAAGANPCISCPDSLSDCEYSAVVAQYGLLETKGIGMYNPIEHQLRALKNARILGQRLGHKVKYLSNRRALGEVA